MPWMTSGSVTKPKSLRVESAVTPDAAEREPERLLDRLRLSRRSTDVSWDASETRNILRAP